MSNLKPNNNKAEFFELPWREDEEDENQLESIIGKSYKYTDDFLEISNCIKKLFATDPSDTMINFVLETLLNHYCKYKCAEEI